MIDHWCMYCAWINIPFRNQHMYIVSSKQGYSCSSGIAIRNSRQSTPQSTHEHISPVRSAPIVIVVGRMNETYA